MLQRLIILFYIAALAALFDLSTSLFNESYFDWGSGLILIGSISCATVLRRQLRNEEE